MVLKWLNGFKDFNLKGFKIIEVFIFIILSFSIFDSNSIERIYFSQHLQLILYVYVIFKLLFDLLKISKQNQKHFNYLIYLILVIEVLLRVSVKRNRINDIGNHKYHAQYSSEFINTYYTSPPFSKIKNNYSEFVFERTYNSLGFSDKEWNINKNNKIRILCLGDSFTEGDGVISDSSYVSILRNNLKNKYQNVEVMNAGHCGSDPFFNFKVYQEKLQKYDPDIILQEFSHNDFYYDIVIRGGNERFINNKKLQFREPPIWEKIYARSYIFRILIHSIGGYNMQLIKEDKMFKIINENTLKSAELFKKYKELTDKNETELIAFTFPVYVQFDNNENIDFQKKIDSSFSKFDLKFYNLQQCYREKVKNEKSNPSDYYWDIDGHHNAKGYEMMAKCLEEIVTPLIEKKINKNISQ